MIPRGSQFGCVFYHESSTDDYKILGAFLCHGGNYVRIHEYSLSTGNWKRIERVVLIHDTFYMFIGTVLNWEKGNRNPVIGFDLITEQFKELSPMDWLEKYNWQNNFNIHMRLRLLELRGCLSLLCTTTYFSKDDVWTLKHSSDGNSWHKLFSINRIGVIYYCFSETGKCLLPTKKKLKVFDPSRETP
ncbi:F-box/kelch-repeat protein At3g06240-like [Chenopodium quinoa]|uniref:F-box/kelch-repeat protein At3g06240-like n=1 Tax=Chenopodium quinoa TaxID=63459 RepID=UPI000B77A041|nr:F-box/kelch-repeat protein At3g06240-like [Chenopodium quinoa]